MFTIENIRVQYGKQIVLSNLNLSLTLKQVHGLVGLNGAGKTTLLNTIYGFSKPQSGRIALNGNPIHRKQLSFLETGNYFYPYITGNEYLGLFPESEKKFDINTWNQLFELPLDKLIDDYSTGMKKKLAFMGILKLDKPILILDEPFNGLDLESVQLVKLIIQRLRVNGKTVLITSHILETLFNCCDHIHYLSQGKIQQSYPKQNFHLIEKEIFSLFEVDKQKIISKLL